MSHGDLREFIDAHGQLLPDFESRARRIGVDEDQLFRQLITELSLSMEELQVTEEELREQNDVIAQSQLRLASEADRYRLLFAQLPVPCLVTDGNGVIRESNRAASELLGVAEPMLSGKPLSVFVPEPERREFRRRLSREGGELRNWTLRIRPRRGRPRLAAVSVKVVPGPAQVTTLIWTLQASDAVEAEPGDASLLSAALDAMPLAACLVDLDGTVLRWNEAAQALTDWDGEMAGRALPLRFGPELGDPIRNRQPVENAPACLLRGDAVELKVQASVRPLEHDGAAAGLLLTFQPRAPLAPPPASDHANAASLLATTAPAAPLLDRLRGGIASGLHLGMIRPGTRLPSVRALAAAAAADHRAVGSVYRTLAAEGLVEVRGRQGVFVARRHHVQTPELSETGAWVARLLGEAAELRLRVPQLGAVLRRWTSARTIRCACLESVEDELVSLTDELRGQWGMDAYPVVAGGGTVATLEQARGAQLIVTTAFHAAEADEAGRALALPVVVMHAAPALTQAISQALSVGPLNVVVADRRYAERLQYLAGSDRLRVHLASDPDSLDGLDPDEHVLVTPAARKRIGDRRLRLLVAPSEFLAQDQAALIAAVMVACNGAAPPPIDA